ncbi:MAG: Gfo/Idh/MocA family oxidoreductase [Kiritimatiellae bacterium]|nr:Gfo/Idh/MocA family oxidoreductase [Kiritimatiellia bacterium]
MIKIAIIGLDTSHSIEFPRRMQAPDSPKNQRVSGMRAVSCLRFETPYQNKEGLDKRQRQLEQWGVKVTENIDEALAGCDAVMLEINDGSFHLEYFRKVAALGKPVFLDKPLAMTLADGRAILELAKKHNTRVWCGSSIPFCPPLEKVIKNSGNVQRAHVFGALGRAPAGDSLIWYGVHSFETLQRIMGPGAAQVRAFESPAAIVTAVEFKDGREGVVELTPGTWIYGGFVWGTANEQKKALPFVLNPSFSYRNILRLIKAFFLGAEPPVRMETTFEGLAMMCAARKAVETGRAAGVETL